LTAGPGGIARPLVATQRYGRGRVLAFSGEAAWRWRMRLPSTDTTYPTFWRQAVRWLAAATPEPLTVRTRTTGVGRLDVLVDVRDDSFLPVRDATVPVRVTGSDGQVQSLEASPDRDTPGTYRVEVRVPPGVTRVDAEARSRDAVLGRHTAWSVAGPDPGELMGPRRDDAQLARLSGRFAGRLITADQIPGVVDEMAAARRDTEALVERDAWHSPWWLLAVLAALVGEWALRRQWGMR
jgi:hypothetical protein